jgi:hypothetical protein
MRDRRGDPVSPSSSKGRARMHRLRRRIAWISARDNSYDRAEASALRWALRLLEELGAADQRALLETHGDTSPASQMVGMPR